VISSLTSVRLGKADDLDPEIEISMIFCTQVTFYILYRLKTVSKTLQLKVM